MDRSLSAFALSVRAIAMLNWCENLEHSRHFLLPRIVGETAESEGGPNQRAEPVSASNRVNFDMLADYTPGNPEERKQAKEIAAAAASQHHGIKQLQMTRRRKRAARPTPACLGRTHPSSLIRGVPQ